MMLAAPPRARAGATFENSSAPMRTSNAAASLAWLFMVPPLRIRTASWPAGIAGTMAGPFHDRAAQTIHTNAIAWGDRTTCGHGAVDAAGADCRLYAPLRINRPSTTIKIRSVTAMASAGRMMGEGVKDSRCDLRTGPRCTSITRPRACAGHGSGRSGWPADRRRSAGFREVRSPP
jgi:hypothetical protein